MAFSYTTIKEETLDTKGNKLIIRGSNTGTGVVVQALIQKTQTVRKKTTTSEMSHCNFFVPGETVSSLTALTLSTILTTTVEGVARILRAAQVAKGTIIIEYSTGSVQDQFSFSILGYFIPAATLSGGDVAGGGYFYSPDLFREEEFAATGTPQTFTLAATPSVNANMKSGRNVLGVFKQTGFTEATKRFYKATPSIVDYDMPAANQIRLSGLVAGDRVVVVYMT